MIREYSINIYSYLIMKSLLIILSMEAKLADSKCSPTAAVTEPTLTPLLKEVKFSYIIEP